MFYNLRFFSQTTFLNYEFNHNTIWRHFVKQRTFFLRIKLRMIRKQNLETVFIK